MANKMTKKDYFQILRDTYPVEADNYGDVIAFIDHELELLARKNGSEKKPTARQKENDNLRKEILAEMVPGQKYSVNEMVKTFNCCHDLTGQRITPLLTRMKNDGLIERVEEKRRAFYLVSE